ncbi:MAG: Stk1 family PASTA domain-containing Ser/Thr kinase [Galactobacter sp.]
MTGTPEEPQPTAGGPAATPQQHVLNDRYELSRLIGRGGMADVWLARDVLLGRDVAVKILRSDLARDETFQARFRREAKAVAGLNDHGIVAVYDTGDTDVQLPGEHVGLKVPFIVMEYVKGHTLKSRLANGPLSLRDASNATLGVLAALAASHAQGIVHRDIKPANVMITEAGTVKVMDFGIARAVADSAATMTQTQAVVGTAQYLSPEQARGETVDARSDLYSTGCLLFELLTGRTPFVGESPVSVAYQHVGEPAPAPSSLNPDVTPQLDAVLARALNKDRDHRFQTAQEFATALRAAQHGQMPAGAYGAAAASADPATAMTQALPMAAAESAPDLAQTGSWTGLIPKPGEDEEAEQQSEAKRKKIIWIVSIILVLLVAVGSFFLVRYLQDQAEKNARVAVPDVKGQTQAQAETALKDKDLVPVATDVFSDDVKRGSVVDTDPGAGMQAKKGSDVTLRVSRGPEQVTIPENLVGKSQDEARKALTDLGFEVSADVTKVEHDKIKKDLVVNTDPALGETVENGSAITLKVSKGQVQIPGDLKGQDVAQATKTLTDLGLKVNGESKTVANDEVEEGKVVGTDPKAGSTVKVGGAVTLQVSDGKVELPKDLVGKTKDEAKKALDDAGLTSQEFPEGDSAKKAGTVIKVEADGQSDGRVSRQALVTVTVSSGKVKVPDVSGKNKDEATKILEGDSYQLKVQIREDHSDTDAPGTVLFQTPQGDETVEAGTTVTLTVADASSGDSGDDDDDD